MSRIGKNPLKIPAGVTVEDLGREVKVTGPKGSVTFHRPQGVKLVEDDGTVTVERLSNSKADRAGHGTARRILGNAVKGVVEPYRMALEVVGVGYQVNIKNGQVALKVGFANEVFLNVPEGVSVETPSATKVVVTGCDKQRVGQLAVNIRRVRPPEPYNGKGVRYEGERIQRKAGKSFSSAG